MGKYTLKIIVHATMVLFFLACSEPDPIGEVVTYHEEQLETKGRVSINFIYNDNQGCSMRHQLLIAKSFRDLYITQRYVASPNVYYNKEIYEVDLEPGDYVYMATLVCTCSDDICAQLGYGWQEDVKEFIEEFTVETGKTTYVTTFNMKNN